MVRQKWFSWLLASLFSLLGLSLLAVALLPYGSMKAVFDLLAKDGDLEMLKPGNAIVFRLLVGAVGLVVLGFAYLTARRLWKAVVHFFGQLWADCRGFLTAPKDAKTEKGFLAAMLAVTLLGLIDRLAYLQGPMLHDESYTVVTFADTLWHAITDYSLPNNHVLNTILINLSVRIFGLAVWSVRLPAFVAGVLLIPGVYFLAKRFYDSWTALAASLLVAFSPMLVHYSTNARGYTLVTLFTLLILGLADYVRRKRNLFAWGLISLFSALGLYTVPVMLFPFAIVFTWLFFENLWAGPAAYSSKWAFFRYWLAAGLVAALLTILFYTPILIFTGPQKLFANSFVAPVPWRDLLVTWHARLIETWSEWIPGVPLVILLVLGIGIILSLAFHRKLSTSRVPLQLAALLAISALLIVQRPNAWSKVWVFLQPLLLIWAAAGTVGLLREIRLKFARNISLAAVVVGAIFLAGLVGAARIAPGLPGRWAAIGDVEATTIYLKGQLQANDYVVVDWPDDAPLWFYFLLHGIKNQHLDKNIPFTRALVLVEPVNGQTLESVIADRGPDPGLLDTQNASRLTTIGIEQVFVCPRK
ncbi:MAG TPA: glycosyltransferase family 39 protein [Anaerolineales bacterium]|nr:glycosyltransferase family 39 protein [Anaerolineales bacterium]